MSRRTIKSKKSIDSFSFMSTKRHQTLSPIISNMNKGFLRVIAKLDTKFAVYKNKDRYVSASLVVQVEKHCDSIYDSYNLPTVELHEYFVQNDVHATCKRYAATSDVEELEQCLDTLQLYTIQTAKDEIYIVHPCEYERMERFLAGTEDPMYDLVHELRYNPNIKLSSEIQEAESHFKKRKSE